MGATERALSRGTRRAERHLAELGAEFREARAAAGVSQVELGRRVGMSGAKVSRVEAGRLGSLSLHDATRLAAVVGLDLAIRAYPYGPRLRDEAHTRRLAQLMGHVGPPLVYRTEVPLPQRADQPRELRAWDAIVAGAGLRTAVELEMRLRDAQALERRMAGKRRDDPVDRFVLAIADTPANRRLLADNPEIFPDLPRPKTSRVLKALRSGEHPATGLILI
jgi:transcriptional regulator with XRE-family HTH domain